MCITSEDSNHTHSPLGEVTGVILAGGKSSRYGKNKAFVEMDGVGLIERVIRVMEPLFQDLVIITNTPNEYAYLKLPMAQDLIKDLGPIGGILTGLEAITEEAGFFVACDMPFLNRPLIRHMVQIRDDFDAVVPRVDWKIETLHAVYCKSCLPAMRELIDAEDYQVIRFFHKIRVRYLEEEEIRTFDPQLKSFFNVNRPAELLEAQKLNFSTHRETKDRTMK